MNRLRRSAPETWPNSRVADAEAFLDIACSTSASIPDPQISSSEVDMESQTSSTSESGVSASAEQQVFSERSVSKESLDANVERVDWCSVFTVFLTFCSQVVVYSLVVPFLCTIAMMPLYFHETPAELWLSYYWLAVCGVALYFSEHNARCGIGLRMRTSIMFLIVLSCAVLKVAEECIMIQRGSRSVGIAGPVAVMLALHAPVIFRLVEFIRIRYSLVPLLWFILYMSWGAIPTATSVTLYWVLVAREWRDDIVMVGVCVTLWSVIPFFVKAVGWRLVYRGNPKAKFCAPLLWILYCDLAFGTLGLPLFMHTPRASLTYAASILPVLLLHMARGADWFSCCCSCRKRVNSAAERRVIRLNSLLEALCAVQGRAVAYIVYLTMMGMNAVFGVKNNASPSRYSWIDGREAPFTMSVQIYRHTIPSAASVAGACLGLMISWGSFCLFAWLLPHVWARSSSVAPASHAETRPRVYSAEDGGGWMLGGDRVQTLNAQYKVIIAFYQRHVYNIISMYAFQWAITSAAVNLAENLVSKQT
eukprot:TRINITY_DN8777_c0_g1_i1.p1 TRINITY_DN8777_c0_g1~~TRINITY_DN8777_c0_g1_i1.p1  ORF type:complete len:534 (-),score=4.88 TRINITY_DN8777_c0_g1_i1:470-2071(-)